MTAEQLLELASRIILRRDSRVLEAGQAVAAANKALVEQGEASASVESEATAVATFKDLAAAYTPDSTADDLAALLASFQAVASARDVRVVEVGQAAEAVAESIREQAEAETADFDETAAIEEFKTAAADYVKE